MENEKVALTLNTKGGTVEKAVIKGYVGHNLEVKDGSADQKVYIQKSRSKSMMMVLILRMASKMEPR